MVTIPDSQHASLQILVKYDITLLCNMVQFYFACNNLIFNAICNLGIHRHSHNDGLNDFNTMPRKCKWQEEKPTFLTLTDNERDNLIAEYKSRPKMWDPAVQMFQDRAYLLPAKHEIAHKLQWDNGMYIHLYEFVSYNTDFY